MTGAEARGGDSEERFRFLLEAVPDIIYRLDHQGRFTYVNRAVRSLGYDPEELIGRHFRAIIHPDDMANVSRDDVIPRMRGMDTRQVKAPKLFDERRTGDRMTRGLQVRLVPKEGADILHASVTAYGEIISTGHYDEGAGPENKQLTGTVGIIRDVTERRNLEDAWRRLVAIVESSNDAIISTTLDYVITSWNGGAERVYGYTAEESIGRAIGMLLPDSAAIKGGTREQILRGETPPVYSCKRRRKDGTILDIEQRLSPIRDIDGRIAGIASISHDATELNASREKEKTLREQLLHSEKMRALGDILSGAAHELNNPLTAIGGFAQLMMAAPNLEECRADLQVIQTESKRCAAIVQNLVAFARKKGPVRAPCDVNRVIRDTLKLHAYRMTADGIAVDLQLSDQIPETMADAHQLQQVFLNVINNAISSMERSAARRITIVSKLIDGGTIRLSFIDSGPGIPPGILPRIFDPFFTTKDVGKGTGLGLSVCYGIVTDHGGSIRASNHPNGGAQFTVDLPVIAPLPVHSFNELEPVCIPDAAGEQVLVVDDEKSCREVVERYLATCGYKVIAAGGVDEAVHILDKNRDIRLIVSDYKMSGKTGENLFNHVSQHRAELAKKFVLISGDVLNPSSAKFIEDSKVHVMEKPVDLEKLHAFLSYLLKA